jgi:hypothetical protein
MVMFNFIYIKQLYLQTSDLLLRSTGTVENVHIADGMSSFKWLIVWQRKDMYFSRSLSKNSLVLTDYLYVSDALFFLVADWSFEVTVYVH